MQTYLDFEKGIAELEGKAEELKALARADSQMDITDEVQQLETKAATHLKDLYGRLTPWQKCMVARHPGRPHAQHYIEALFDEFTPLAGDRGFGEDHAIISGIARFKGRPVIILGQERGFDTKSRLYRNFGMARPEGYRKSIRLMEMADRFNLPVIAFIDTPGAYPGKGAEERGQSEAIARCTEKCLEVKVPIIAIVIGEGGSGGAVALATANRIAMLEHAVYSVISPEGCASILWKSADKAQEAAAALRLTAQDLSSLGVNDAVIEEPIGGAQRAPSEAIAAVGATLMQMLVEFDDMAPEDIRGARRRKFLEMGQKKLA